MLAASGWRVLVFLLGTLLHMCNCGGVLTTTSVVSYFQNKAAKSYYEFIFTAPTAITSSAYVEVTFPAEFNGLMPSIPKCYV